MWCALLPFWKCCFRPCSGPALPVLLLFFRQGQRHSVVPPSPTKLLWLSEAGALPMCESVSVFAMADLNSSDIWRHFAHIFPFLPFLLFPPFIFFIFILLYWWIKNRHWEATTKTNSKAAYKIEKCLRGGRRPQKKRGKKNRKTSASCQSFMDWHMAHQQGATAGAWPVLLVCQLCGHK